ncbi:MAG: dihydroorotase family protein, partial [Nitrososphaerota archaeon]|nr:dihydroorotase family protein [Nitrososphaerota archaeon]
RNGSVVFPNSGVVKTDIGINGGKISQIGSSRATTAKTVIDATGKHVFPGLIDSHFHVGIYRPLDIDAKSESASAVAGGVTSILSYFRSGKNYLNSAAPYSELFKKVLDLSSGNFYCDYGYHLAPVTATHLLEIRELVKKFGVSTFKFYMFYRGLVLKGEFRKGAVEREYLLSEDPYDLGHLSKMMSTVSEINKTTSPVRVSVHAEDAELIRINIEETKTKKKLNPLEAYNEARPPESERLALVQAIELAMQTHCPVNILHVSSGLALQTIKELRLANPDLDVMVEVTVHHLMLNDKYNPSVFGKVNPPIRTDSDQESLWNGIQRGDVNTVASDHACITRAEKGKDIWSAEPGFGGTELLLPSLITGGYFARKIPLESLASLVTLNPAKFHGLSHVKGDIVVGLDGDLAIVDMKKKMTVDHKKMHSAQDFSPFDGIELAGWAETTILRGKVVFNQGKVVGKCEGNYLERPASSRAGRS